MNTYKFKVTVTDCYQKIIEIEGENAITAEYKLRDELTAHPLAERSNSFLESDTYIEIIKNK